MSRAVIAAEAPTKTFTEEAFSRIMRSSSLLGAYGFWIQLECCAEPGERICRRAEGILREMAKTQYRNCRGVAHSPQEAMIFRKFGLRPVRVMEPGECAQEDE
jgi:hypothetical protein